MNKRLLSVVALSLLLVLVGGVLPTSAQDMPAPSVEVANQLSLDGTVTVAKAYSEGPGFIVIHTGNAEGGIGPGIGVGVVNPGWNYNVNIKIDTRAATSTLFAMLHVDDNEVGVYEFGTVEGADGPVVVDGQPVTPPFNVDIVNAADQFVDGDTVTINSVTAQAAGWLVIHAGDASSFGAVLGQTFVEAGTTTDVAVTLAADGRTPVLWPMLHVDTGTIGTYEFGAVQGADGPVVLEGKVATFPIWTVPHIRVSDQVVLHGDGMDMTDMVYSLVAESVLSEGPGFLVVHIDQDGTFGPVAGLAAVPAGLSANVTIELGGEGMEAPTAVLWPMLHVDTGEVGAYEFGTVEGADGPVVVDGQVVTFPIQAAPSITYELNAEAAAMMPGMSVIVIKQAIIDAPGWLVIHSNNNGAPGPVLGAAPLRAGVNTNVAIELDLAQAGDLVFPMLHYDTGTAGAYEFGSVEGADLPVSVGGSVVVGPLNLTQ
jgi:hypothetical protein